LTLNINERYLKVDGVDNNQLGIGTQLFNHTGYFSIRFLVHPVVDAQSLMRLKALLPNGTFSGSACKIRLVSAKYGSSSLKRESINRRLAVFKVKSALGG